jgi:hypothetical protein
MEVVLLVAACGRLLEYFVAPLLALPVASVMHFTQTVINLVLIVATVRVLHSWQTRFFAEMLFQAEMSGARVARGRCTQCICARISCVCTSAAP